jgi:hypothetical protein
MQKYFENLLKVWVEFLKSKVEIILDVSCFNLAPRMAIMLLIHSLLIRLTIGIDNKG